jgi:hypothetical protein
MDQVPCFRVRRRINLSFFIIASTLYATPLVPVRMICGTKRLQDRDREGDTRGRLKMLGAAFTSALSASPYPPPRTGPYLMATR